MERDPRRLIVRLAVATLTADGRVTPSERQALARLDLLGLGALSAFAEEEIARAAEEPIDVASAVAGLRGVSRETAAVLLFALTEVAANDGTVSPKELAVLATVAEHLDLSRDELMGIVHSVTAGAGANGEATGDMLPPAHRRGQSETISTPVIAGVPHATLASAAPGSGLVLERAYRILGLSPGDPSHAETAYLALVDRYNPTKVSELGADFAALAVRRLAEVTAAFEMVRAARRERQAATMAGLGEHAHVF
jgi:uncharacterized tellurite resistance protein B-like protein